MAKKTKTGEITPESFIVRGDYPQSDRYPDICAEITETILRKGPPERFIDLLMTIGGELRVRFPDVSEAYDAKYGFNQGNSFGELRETYTDLRQQQKMLMPDRMEDFNDQTLHKIVSRRTATPLSEHSPVSPYKGAVKRFLERKVPRLGSEDDPVFFERGDEHTIIADRHACENTVNTSDNTAYLAQFTATHNGTTVPLTTITNMVLTTPSDGPIPVAYTSNGDTLKYDLEMKGGPLTLESSMVHPSFSRSLCYGRPDFKIGRLLEETYAKACDPELPHEEREKAALNLFSYVSHAMPAWRGSGTLSHIILTALAAHIGFDMPLAREDHSFNIEAMLRGIDEYYEAHKNMELYDLNATPDDVRRWQNEYLARKKRQEEGEEPRVDKPR